MVLALAACNTESQAGSGATLASWRDQTCTALKGYANAFDGPKQANGTSGLAVPPAEAATIRKAVSDIQAIPLPTDLHSEAKRFVGIVVAAAVAYENALPEIEAASRRLEKAIESIDPGSLPPPPVDQTVAGGIMSQMMSVPEVREAWDAMLRAYQNAAPTIDQKEAEQLTKKLGLSHCANQEDADPADKRLSAAELKRCGARGAPITLARLVRVFRANGITLSIDEPNCLASEKARKDAALTDATNAGRTGLEISKNRKVERAEGSILCRVYRSTSITRRKVYVTKYSTDNETYVDTQNVDCAVYPYDQASEKPQVERVRRAMVALVAGLPRD